MRDFISWCLSLVVIIALIPIFAVIGVIGLVGVGIFKIARGVGAVVRIMRRAEP